MQGSVSEQDYRALQNAFSELSQECQQLKAELDQLKRLLFGRKSERHVATGDVGQLALALEGAEQPVPTPASTEQITYTRKKKTKAVGRHPLPEHLPRVRMVIEPEEDTTGMVCIGEEITELLGKRPASCYVMQIVRRKYARPNGMGVLIGPMP